VAHLDLTGTVVTLDALHTQAETARYLAEDKRALHLMIVKASQPTLLETIAQALAGPDRDFAEATWTEDGAGHGRRERRSIRTAPPTASPGRMPPRSSASAATAAPPMAPGRTGRSHSASPACLPRLAGPRHLASDARRHWAVENREH
jgi:predicted transposase YbfD/YdcC